MKWNIYILEFLGGPHGILVIKISYKLKSKVLLLFLLLFIKNNLKNKFLLWCANVFNWLHLACRYIHLGPHGVVIVFAIRCCHLNTQTSDHARTIFPLGYDECRLCNSYLPKTQSYPFLSVLPSPPTEVQGQLSFIQCLCYRSS